MVKNEKHGRKIIANFNEYTIRVYQAYSSTIANEAVRLGTFGQSFKLNRMTWIKPSFLWTMHRSGWAKKEGQERILAIDIKRSGFDYILENVVLSSYQQDIYGEYDIWKTSLENSDVRCQWDPDKDIYGNHLGRCAIQLGLKGEMVKKYINDWIVKITDITEFVVTTHVSIEKRTFNESILPQEKEYWIQRCLRTFTMG